MVEPKIIRNVSVLKNEIWHGSEYPDKSNCRMFCIQAMILIPTLSPIVGHLTIQILDSGLVFEQMLEIWTKLHKEAINQTCVGILKLQKFEYATLNSRISTVQWGSEIRTSLDFEWSKRGWVATGLDFE